MLQFRLFGFPFYIHWFFWLGGAVLGGGLSARTPDQWLNVLVWIAVVLISITAHELGHAIVARRFGGSPSILLHGMGGVTFLRGLDLSKWPSIAVSIAGPAASLLLGIVSYGIAIAFPPQSELARQTMLSLLWVNFAWTAFNLLPVLPMDGGQIFRALLGPSRLKIARITGAVVAFAVAVPAWLYGLYFAAILLVLMGIANLRDQPLQGGVTKE